MHRLLLSRAAAATAPSSPLHYARTSVRLSSSSTSSDGDVSSSPLAITLPDLTPHEHAYIRSQLSYISTLNSDHLRPCSWEKAEFLVRQEYPWFLKGHKSKSSDRLYRHLTKSAVLTQRTAKALKELGIPQNEVVANPSLLSYPLLSLPRDAQAKFLLDIPLESVVKKRRREPLRGMHVREVMDDLMATLNALDMSDQASSFDGVRLSPKSRGAISLEELNQRAVLAFVKNSFPEDFVELAAKVLKANSVLVDRAKNVDRNCAPVPSVNAKMFVRNHWLFHRILVNADDLFTQKMFRALSLNVCPLETLITLNDLYRSCCPEQEMSVSEFLQVVARNAMHYLLMPSTKLPPSLRMKLLGEIGFETREAADILLSRHKAFSESPAGGAKQNALRFTSSSYIPTMQRRLQVMRSDGRNLGITCAVDAFSAMTNWTKVLDSVKSIREQNLQGLCLHYVNNPHGIKIAATREYRSVAGHPALEHVCKYFNCETVEQKQAVRKDLFVSPMQRAIPISRVLSSLAYLEERGFSKAQIRKALPLLFYPTTLIDQKVVEMQEMPDFADGAWRAEENVLHCCLYFLEKEFHFTTDGLWTGLQLDFSRGLYDELEKEVGYVCKDRRSASLPAQQQSTAQQQASPAVRKDHRTHSQLQQRGIRQFSTSCRSPGWVGFSGRAFYIQNPFKMLRINGEFQKLREWDPDLEKQSFLEATRQAVATVTQLIQESNYSDLKGLLSRRERERLQREVETSWSDVMRNNVALDVDEVVLAVPERVRQQSVAYQKFCDIDVVFVAIKEEQEQQAETPIKINARFHRDYTEGKLPDWVITRFEVEQIVKK